MNIASVAGLSSNRLASDAAWQSPWAAKPPKESADDAKTRKAFDSFVGETFYGQMLKAMRKTQNKPAYFHGGRAEEIFQQQLDQVLAQKLSETSAEKLSGPMYDLFTLSRS